MYALVMNIMKIMMIIVMIKVTTLTPAPNKLLVMIIMKILRLWRCYLASSGDHDDRSIGGDDDMMMISTPDLTFSTTMI